MRKNLSKLVDKAQKEKAGGVFDQRGQTVHGTQTNIGEANAPVFSGNFSGPVNMGESERGKNQ